jgi:hypothetical protein
LLTALTAPQQPRQSQPRQQARIVAGARSQTPRTPPPPPQVLDARQIERVDDTTFRCFVGQLSFFSWSIEPVITVSVEVQEQGCTIRLLSCELQGSPSVEELNSRFTAQMTNVVRWQHGDSAELKLMTSSTSIQVGGWGGWSAGAAAGLELAAGRGGARCAAAAGRDAGPPRLPGCCAPRAHPPRPPARPGARR